MRDHDFDRAIEKLTRRQHGAFSWAQVQRLDGTHDMVSDRLRSGAWVRLEPGVYALPSHPGTWLRQLKAAELGAPGSAVGGLAAAALHGLPEFRQGSPEIVVPPGRTSRSRLARVHRYGNVRITRVDGIRVTTIAQTLFDIAPRVPMSQLERAIDDALLTGRLTVASLNERRAAYAGSRRPGLPLLRALIDERRVDGWVPPESELEARLWPLVLAVPGMSGAIRQPELPWLPAEPGRVDILIPGWRTIVEGDGRRWHARVNAFDADRWRDNEAVAHGYRLLRFTWVHVTRRPAEVLDLIERVGVQASLASA